MSGVVDRNTAEARTGSIVRVLESIGFPPGSSVRQRLINNKQSVEIVPKTADLGPNLTVLEYLLGLFCVANKVLPSKVRIPAVQQFATHFWFATQLNTLFCEVLLTPHCLTHSAHVPCDRLGTHSDVLAVERKPKVLQRAVAI